MKLLNFQIEGRALFGLVLENHAAGFGDLQRLTNDTYPHLNNIQKYLTHLPESETRAAALAQAARDLPSKVLDTIRRPLPDIKILPPVPRPTALIDFGLTPKHLINSARTMMRYEMGPFFGRIMAAFLARKIKKASASEALPYYKANHLTVIGDQDVIGWPGYTSYLDIEPELAVIIGSNQQKIAGYTIFNDASARDVQFPEMMGSGPARSKDFADGNGLGPFLVTPDEIPDPLSLNVSVKIGTRHLWKGHTSEYSLHPEKVIAYFETIAPLLPGTVLGLGTIPGCTGLDNDKWIQPGDLIEMTFEKLGTLHQAVPATLPSRTPTRWRPRTDLQ